MESLPKRPLGRTGLLVTPICVGCAALGNMPEAFAVSVPEDRARATLEAVFRSPINFLDTSAIYGEGESERRIGLVVRDLGGVPAGYVIATKADRDPLTGDFSGDQMKRSVERSLRLLGVDRLPLVHLHDPEHTTFEKIVSRGGALEALLRLKDEGVIEHLGIAGGPVDLLIRFVETGAFEAVITHNRYTLIHRGANPLLDVARGRGLAVLNAAPFGSGVLAKGSTAYPRYAYQAAAGDVLERIRQAEAICQRLGVPTAAAALQLSLRDPRIDCTIVGMTRPERIAQVLALASQAIPDDLWPQLEALALTGGDPEAARWG